MFKSFSSFWDKHGLNVLVGVTIAFFLIYWLFFTRHKAGGTYSTSYYYDPKTSKLSMTIHPSSYASETSSVSSKKSSSTSSSKRGPPQCSKGERLCKNYLEYVFERPFQKVRPPFLYNTVTNANLELDMFNPELRLACEYHGRQHYEYDGFMHGNSRANFHNQLYRDKEKMELCAKNGVQLIVVPYTVPLEKIPAFLKEELVRRKIPGVKKSL